MRECSKSFKIIARSKTIITGCTFLQKRRIEILYYAKKVLKESNYKINVILKPKIKQII